MSTSSHFVHDQLSRHPAKEGCVAATVFTVNPTQRAPDVLDGVSLSVDDRVLVKDQFNPSGNGIYSVVDVGGGINGEWERTDLDGDLYAGSTVHVISGDVNGGSRWRVSSPGMLSLGSSPIHFFKDSSSDRRQVDYHEFVPLPTVSKPSWKFEGWETRGSKLVAVKVHMATVNSGGTYQLTLLNVHTTNTMLSSSPFSMNGLSNGDVFSVPISSTDADLTVDPDDSDGRWTLTLTAGTPGSFNGAGIQVEPVFEVLELPS